MAVGRLPVRSVSEAAAMVAKIISYEQAARPEGVLLVADDRWSLPPLVKFGLQLLIALIAVLGISAAFGLGTEFQITFLSLPGVGIVKLGLLAVPVSLFWMLGMQNTVNLLDGVDVRRLNDLQLRRA